MSLQLNSSKAKRSISILVVDDDITCLSIVAALLKQLKYQVVTAKHPNDALCALRVKGGAGAFDLVVSDIHMPDMNGFQLQQAITYEFNLPVVLMSVDSKEVVFSKGLGLESAGDAFFFISKPVSPNDLKDLWQFASKKTSDDQVVVIENYINNSSSKTSKATSKEGNKKTKVTWTDALHCRFLEAIRTIGLEKSVPKKILQVMNVPGLTRDNVASHLQKYRIFLKRVSDASKLVNIGDDRRRRSSCISNYPAYSYSYSSPTTASSCHSLLTLNNSSSSRLIQDFPNRFWYQQSPSPSIDQYSGLMMNIRSVGGGFDQYRSSQVGTTASNDFMHQYSSNNYVGFNFGGYDHYDLLQNNMNNHYSGCTINGGQQFIANVGVGYTHYHDQDQDNLSFIGEKEQGLLLTHHLPAFLDIQNQNGCFFTNDSSYHHQPVYQQVQGAIQSVQSASPQPQLNKTLQSHNQCGDDAVLESLLAFGEDQIQTLEGI